MTKRILFAALLIPSLLLWGCGKHSDGKSGSSKNSKAQAKTKRNSSKTASKRNLAVKQTPLAGPKTSAEVRTIVDAINPPKPAGTGKVLAIVFSGGIRGEIEPCG